MANLSTRTPGVYDRFVSEMAVLKCVQSVLESAPDMGTQCKMSSAELALRNCIGRLGELYGAIETLEHQARRDVTERVRKMFENPAREVSPET